MDYLLNNSITLVFLITAAILARSEYRRYLTKKQISTTEFWSSLRLNLNTMGNGLLIKLVNSVLIAATISIVSFRELWVNDVFHTVFLTLLLARPLHKRLKNLFE